jgi:hypothetical protein
LLIFAIKAASLAPLRGGQHLPEKEHLKVFPCGHGNNSFPQSKEPFLKSPVSGDQAVYGYQKFPKEALIYSIENKSVLL